MSPLSLFFLLFSADNAFSPAALPRSQHRAIGSGSPRCTTTSSHPLSRCKAAGRSSNNANHPLSFRSIDSNGKNNFRTPSSLAAVGAATAEQRQFNYKKRIAIFMAFMTGWADFMFIKRYNFFATMMTGNSMKMGVALVDGRVRDALFFLSIISSYIIGVGTFRRAELSCKDNALNGLFAPIVAGCFLLSDYLSWIDPSFKFVPAALLAFSWGIINSVGSEVTGTLVFVVTGAMVSHVSCVVGDWSLCFKRVYSKTREISF